MPAAPQTRRRSKQQDSTCRVAAVGVVAWHLPASNEPAHAQEKRPALILLYTNTRMIYVPRSGVNVYAGTHVSYHIISQRKCKERVDIHFNTQRLIMFSDRLQEWHR